MKAIEQYFHVVLFIMLCKVVLSLSFWIKPYCVIIQMKAIERSTLLLNAVTFCYDTVAGSVKPLVCDNSSRSYLFVNL